MAINIEKTISKAASRVNRRWIGVHFYEITGADNVHDAHFFLDTELGIDLNPLNYQDHKANGRIRHCKIDYSGYYDYIAKKEFDTLEEWAADCGSDVSHIRFGINRVYLPGGTHVSVSLQRLLDHIGPVYDQVQKPPAEEISDTKIVDLLRMKNLTLDNLWVIVGGDVIQWQEFAKQ
jgi:hypothetical protein